MKYFLHYVVNPILSAIGVAIILINWIIFLVLCTIGWICGYLIKSSSELCAEATDFLFALSERCDKDDKDKEDAEDV